MPLPAEGGTRWVPNEPPGLVQLAPTQPSAGFPWLLVIAIAVLVLGVSAVIAAFILRRRRDPWDDDTYDYVAEPWHQGDPTVVQTSRRIPPPGGGAHPGPSPKSTAEQVRRSGAATLGELIALRPELQRDLVHDGIDLAWPYLPEVGAHGELFNCLSEPVPDRFLNDGMPRTLDQAITTGIGRAEREVLLIRVARFLQAMHRHNWAFGAVWWESFLYSLDGDPRLLVRNAEFARPSGDEAAFAARLRKEWSDPDPSQACTFPTIQTDRFRFAVMVNALLVANDPKARLTLSPGLHSAVDPRGNDQIGYLVGRSVQAQRSRPSMTEWLSALPHPSRADR